MTSMKKIIFLRFLFTLFWMHTIYSEKLINRLEGEVGKVDRYRCTLLLQKFKNNSNLEHSIIFYWQCLFVLLCFSLKNFKTNWFRWKELETIPEREQCLKCIVIIWHISWFFSWIEMNEEWGSWLCNLAVNTSQDNISDKKVVRSELLLS